MAETQVPHSFHNLGKAQMSPNSKGRDESNGLKKKLKSKKASRNKKVNKKTLYVSESTDSHSDTEAESDFSKNEERMRKKAAKAWKIGEQAGLIVEEKGRAIQALLEDWVEKKEARKQSKRRKSRGKKKVRDDISGEEIIS